MKDKVLEKITKRAIKNNKSSPIIGLQEAADIRNNLFVDEHDYKIMDIARDVTSNPNLRMNVNTNNKTKESKTFFKNRASKDRAKYYSSLSLMFLSYFWASYSLYYSYANDDMGIFFQRSGAIIVLFSAIGEYLLSQIERHNIVITNPMGGYFSYSHRILPKKYYNLLLINLVSIVLGTFIWGYGDTLSK